MTPREHTRIVKAAPKGAGVPVESRYYPTEGHGFYTGRTSASTKTACCPRSPHRRGRKALTAKGRAGQGWTCPRPADSVSGFMFAGETAWPSPAHRSSLSAPSSSPLSWRWCCRPPTPTWACSPA
nr:hypothetical protein [Pseudoxanthomonas daejeonensis]